MKYILNNPAFTTTPITITNNKAVELLKSYITRPNGLKCDDEILLVIHDVIIRLKVYEIHKDKYIFNQVQNRYSKSI